MEEKTKRSAAEEVDSSTPKKLARTDPPSINYLFTIKHSCIFLVGDQAEEIGVNKDTLMAYSEVFRLMLQDSALAEKGHVRIKDIEPDTFKNLLRFVYGNNIVSTLTMEDAMDLMYVAEKYLVEELKPELSTHISSMLTVENVCIPLKRPECYAQKSLKNAIDKKIQGSTGNVLKQQHFLELNTFGIVNILKLDPLAVNEIELWRGVLKWARHNAKKEGCTPLRKLLSEPLKHIRFCTLAMQDFGQEVVLTNVLSDYEVSKIVKSIFSQTLIVNLTSVCNSIQTRNVSSNLNVKYISISSPHYCSCAGECNVSSVTIVTNQSPITMMAAWFECKPHSKLGETENLKFQCECNVSVTRIDYASNKTSPERVVEFDFKKEIDYGKKFNILLNMKNKYINLERYSEYTFTFKFRNFLYTSIKCFSKCQITFDEGALKEIKINSSAYSFNSSYINSYNKSYNNSCNSSHCSLVKHLAYKTQK